MNCSRRNFLTRATVGMCLLALPEPVRLKPEAETMGPLKQPALTGYLCEDAFLDFKYENSHPESPKRLIAINRMMEQSGLIARVKRLVPLIDPLPAIKLIHTAQHIKAINTIEHIGTIASQAVAGALTAVTAVHKHTVRNAFCALRPPGHHALNTGREEGFCYYNNSAIAARYAQTLGYKKVLIVDWDFHHGNGTEAAFYEDPTVLFFSTHNRHAYPGTGDPGRIGAGAGKGFNINVHFECRATDHDFLKVFRTILIPRAIEFKPDIVLLSAGFDSRRDDTLGCFDISDAGFVNLTRIVMDIAHTCCNDRLVSLLEGGYNTVGLAQGVLAHVTTLTEYQPKTTVP